MQRGECRTTGRPRAAARAGGLPQRRGHSRGRRRASAAASAPGARSAPAARARQRRAPERRQSQLALERDALAARARARAAPRARRCRPGRRQVQAGGSLGHAPVVRRGHARSPDRACAGSRSRARCCSACIGELPISRWPMRARPAGEQRQPHPAFELDRGRRGGHVAEASARGACAATSWAPLRRRRARSSGRTPTSCRRSGALSAGALRQRAADEVAVLFQQALKAQIRRAGVAIDLGRSHVALLDAQRVERIQAVGRRCRTARRPRAAPVHTGSAWRAGTASS